MKIHTCIALFSAVALQAGNTVFNSGFELGEKGWSGMTETKVAKDGSRLYTGPGYRIDPENAASGKKSIRLENGKFDTRTVLFSHDIPVQEGKTYTVSFLAKSAKPQTLSVYLRTIQRPPRRNPDGSIIPPKAYTDCAPVRISLLRPEQAVRLTTEWKRYSFSVKPEKGFTAYVFTADLHARNNPVWIDNVQVEEGALTDYRPQSQIEAAVIAPDRVKDAKSISGTLRVISYGKARKEFETELSLYDLHHDKVTAKQKIKCGLEADEVKELPFSLAGVRYGMYNIHTSLQPRKTTRAFMKSDENASSPPEQKPAPGDLSYQSSAYVASIPEPPARVKTGYRMGPCISLEGELYQKTSRDGYGMGYEPYEVLRDSGSTTCRIWNLFYWCYIQPDGKGKFEWSFPDDAVKKLEKAGIDFMVTITGAGFRNAGTLPEWVKKRDSSGNPKGGVSPVRLPRDGKFSVLWRPRQEDFREFMTAVAKRYKGKVRYYEIFNEPQLWMGEKDYVKYLKTAWESIKQEDPAATVTGICATSDFNLNSDSFIEKSLRLGAGANLDAVSFHPYGTLDNSVPTLMSRYRGMYKNLRKYGIDKPLINTENYFFNAGWTDWVGLEHRWQPDAFARHHIIDMGEGIPVSTTAPYDSALFSNFHQPNQYLPGVSRLGRSYPNIRYVIQATTSHFLSGAEPVYTAELPAGALGYVFRRNGRIYSAIWNSRAGQRSWIGFDLPKGVSFRLYDLFANRIGDHSGKTELELNSEPWYLEWIGANGQQTADFFRKAAVRCENPLGISNAYLLDDGQKQVLNFTVQNMGAKKDREAEIRILSAQFKKPLTVRRKELAESFRPVNLELPAELNEKPGKSVEATIESSSGGSRKTVFQYRKSVKVSYAPRTFELTKILKGKQESAKDLSAKLTLNLKNVFTLHVKVEVRDDGKPGNPKDPVYLRDGIELFTDLKPFAGDNSGYTKECSQYLFGREERRLMRRGLSGTLTAAADGYVAEMDLAIGKANRIGFDLAINDSDGSTLKSKLVWNGDNDNHRNRSGFMILEFDRSCGAVISTGLRGKDGTQKIWSNEFTPAPLDGQWRELKLSFVPDVSGEARLVLRTASAPGDCCADFRNLRISGAEFELNGKKPFSGGWRKPCVGKIFLEAGKKVTIQAQVKRNQRF